MASTRPLLPDQVINSDSNVPEEDDFNDELQEYVIMAVNVGSKGNVGCCYYTARDEKLLLMADVGNRGLEILDSCKQKALYLRFSLRIAVKASVQPTVVILPLQISERAELCFDPDGRARAGASDRGTFIACIKQSTKSKKSCRG